MAATTPRRVLLVLAGLIGDAVMCTPVLVEARRLWPGARIALLGNPRTCELLAACPLVDACVATPVIPFTLRKRRLVADLRRWLIEQDFDLAIILLGDQFARVLAEARIPTRVGVRGHVLAPFLTATYETGRPQSWGPSERLGALRALGHDVRDVPPRLWVSDRARLAARARLSELGLPAAAPYAVLHPFGSTREKWWPAEQAAALARSLEHESGLRTVLIGGRETRGAFRTVSLPAGTTDATGALALPETLAVIEDARLVVSTDSGPYHIAGALGRPLVGLFRARRPEHAGRYPGAAAVLGQHLSCARRCRWDRCRGTPCRQMTALSATDVRDAVRRLMGGTGRP